MFFYQLIAKKSLHFYIVWQKILFDVKNDIKIKNRLKFLVLFRRILITFARLNRNTHDIINDWFW